jgi:uncharacterized protein (DUF2235 family)
MRPLYDCAYSGVYPGVMPVTQSRSPRNIVLLSDGTGNSSAKLMKTNVWRMYEAIELRKGDQIALYDNGVGTSSFKPMAVLGGGLGWGLKRNVRTLYKFACANYQPGDRIFAFGFSRGAFTIRVLLGLIADQGLIKDAKGRELQRRAKWAYREYRRRFNPTKGLVTPLRAVRDWILRRFEGARGLQPYSRDGNQEAAVSFAGLWDTVDAYGLPMDEMTRGWDQWVWPLSITDHECPDNVEKVCHAVALDDERHTFHPVLLDERKQVEAAKAKGRTIQHTDEEKVTQVWFAGVHSNVGGGYPDDSLAHVSLLWMAAEACKQGLRLHSRMRSEWAARADPNGPISDSRRGLGAYYRYNPRSIQKLTDDRFADVRVPRPKIHESVIERIKVGLGDYAPIVLPDTYDIVGGTGALSSGAGTFEHPTQSASRCGDQERVWNLVWWRRITYFTTVALTTLLLARPFVFDSDAGGLFTMRPNWTKPIVELLAMFVPDAGQPWVEFYRNHPIELVLLAGLIGALLVASSQIQRAITDRMRLLWDETVKRPGTAVTPSGTPTDWVFRLRSARWYRNVVETMSQRVFPFLFGVGCLAAVVLVVVGTVNRATFAAYSASGQVCTVKKEFEVPSWNGEPRQVPLPSNELCLQTGLELKQGQRYRVEIVLPDPDAVKPDDRWMDKRLPVESPEGFSSGTGPAFMAFLPFRRVLTAPWFVPMVRVGDTLAEYHRIDQIEEVPLASGTRRGPNEPRRIRGFVEFTPAFTGQMFLFVNDAVLPGPWVKTLYKNNHGTATVTVRAIEPELIGTKRSP